MTKLNERSAVVDARVKRFSGYTPEDVTRHQFKAIAELSIKVRLANSEELTAEEVIPVIVTAPEYPYQSHNIECAPVDVCVLHCALTEKDPAWWGVDKFVGLQSAVASALTYEELPELEEALPESEEELPESGELLLRRQP